MIVMYMEIFCDHFFLIRYFFYQFILEAYTNLNIDDMWNSEWKWEYESNDVMTKI